MIDAHVYLEKGDYSVEWIEQFIAYAVKRSIGSFSKCKRLFTINFRL